MKEKKTSHRCRRAARVLDLFSVSETESLPFFVGKHQELIHAFVFHISDLKRDQVTSKSPTCGATNELATTSLGGDSAATCLSTVCCAGFHSDVLQRQRPFLPGDRERDALGHTVSAVEPTGKVVR